MKEKKQNEELQSRREFFKEAAKKALPVIGTIALISSPVIAKAAETPMGCGGMGLDCRYTCQGGCKGGCQGSCTGSCSGGCLTTCYSACANDCSGTCKGNCYGQSY